MPAFEEKRTDDSQTQRPHEHLEGERGVLKIAGFQQAEDGLWEKNGVYYGREAAWQEAWRELRNSSGSYLYQR